MDYEKYIKNKDKQNNKTVLYFKCLLSRTFLAIILLLVCIISIKLKADNKELLNKYIFTENLKFNKANKYFKNNVGNIIPTITPKDKLVFNSSELKTKKYEEKDGYVKINLEKSSPISTLRGGIVVFIGEKEGLGNTVIVQGNDGFDIWYSNITNTSISLYDYIEKDSLIGEASGKYINLKILKDGKNYNYEEYIK